MFIKLRNDFTLLITAQAVVVGIVDQFRIPIKFVGIGEGVDDLKVFDKKEFVGSLFSKEDLEK